MTQQPKKKRKKKRYMCHTCWQFKPCTCTLSLATVEDIQKAISQEREFLVGLIRAAYCEGILDGRDATSKSWKIDDFKAGKDTTRALNTILYEATAIRKRGEVG